jgi:crotonobetainyl-CoA:carnitine CoA-transferase CaiB-like acyl-CoA transferase
VKVLDLTRVLAGPVAGRFLAAFGANVLRIDPPGWNEPGVIPEVTLGKRCATLDLKDSIDFEKLTDLIQKADVLLHGYRANALENLGLTKSFLNKLNPNLINVSLNAYGWNNPWENRRGFDSLVQMSSGIAHYGMLKSGANKPTPLPVQALDHATGYLMAASVIQALELRDTQNLIVIAKHSLAATAGLLLKHPRATIYPALKKVDADDYASEMEITDWGEAVRIAFPVTFPGVQVGWHNGAAKLHSSNPSW